MQFVRRMRLARDVTRLRCLIGSGLSPMRDMRRDQSHAITRWGSVDSMCSTEPSSYITSLHVAPDRTLVTVCGCVMSMRLQQYLDKRPIN